MLEEEQQQDVTMGICARFTCSPFQFFFSLSTLWILALVVLMASTSWERDVFDRVLSSLSLYFMSLAPDADGYSVVNTSYADR